MITSRRIETIAGVATGLLALLNPSSFVLAQYLMSPSNTKEKLLALLSSLITFIGPAILVTIGSYTHAVRQKSRGLVMVLVGSVILIVMGFVAFLGGLFYVFGPWWGVVILLPSAMATVTLIASLFVRFERR
jgi:hypothetical protein